MLHHRECSTLPIHQDRSENYPVEDPAALILQTPLLLRPNIYTALFRQQIDMISAH